jgi:rhodanese-related sulfurtransferase
MADAPRITIEDLQAKMSDGLEPIFIDTRNPQAWAESDVKIPSAVRVPLDSLDDSLPDIPKDKPIVTYCT